VIFWCLHCQEGPEPIINAKDLADTVPNFQTTVQLPGCFNRQHNLFEVSKQSCKTIFTELTQLGKKPKASALNIHFTQV